MSTSSSAPPSRPLNVIFVGAFQAAAKDGAVGGTLFASRSLVASPLGEHLRWILIDSTGRSVPPPSVPVRAFFASARMARFVAAVVRPSTDATLIFAGGGLGFLEKGLMAVLSSAAGKPVLLSPRSGAMPEEIARSRVQRWVVTTVLRRCDRIVCQGETWVRFYQELTGLPLRRLVSIPNWIDMAEYASIKQGPRRPGPPTFLYLGWLETYKGVIDLIHAVHRCHAALGGAKVAICGRGSAAEEAKRLVRELGLEDTIEFRGWVLDEQKRAVLAECDVLVLPSHIEGLPNALLEAMATGLAVIATRVGAIPDAVVDGESGLLIAPGDVDALAAALTRLASDATERERLAKAAQEKIARDHDIAVAWPRVLAAIEEAVDDRRRGLGVGCAP